MIRRQNLIRTEKAEPKAKETKPSTESFEPRVGSSEPSAEEGESQQNIFSDYAQTDELDLHETLDEERDDTFNVFRQKTNLSNV